jgi:ACS family glucarate transporter-like MFS transporter
MGAGKVYSGVDNTKRTNVRWEVVVAICILGFIAYIDRVNLSVAAPFIMKEFGIDKVQLGMIMSAFFIPYMLMQLPGGIIAQRWGTRWIPGFAILGWSLFTILTAFAWGFLSLVVIRALFGFGEGPIFPSFGVTLARWTSVKEKAWASSFMLVGPYAGPIIGQPVTVWIMTMWSWRTVFYVYGLVGAIGGLFWLYHHRNHPSEHPRVNKAELEYITSTSNEAAIAAHARHEHAPWGKWLTSYQFWAFGFMYFAVGYMMFLFLSWLPVYLLEAGGLSLKAMGIASAYPWLAMCTVIMIWGKVSDVLVGRGYSKFKVRTIPGFIGLFVCSLSFLMAANVQTVNENLFWLTMTLGFCGFTYNASMATMYDLGGRFGGSIMGWIQTTTNIAGITAPVVTAMLVKSFGWGPAIMISSVVPFLGALSWFLVRPDRQLPGTEDPVV